MKNLGNKSKMLAAFASGAVCAGLLQVAPLKASTNSLSGTCVGIGNYSVWGWSTGNGSSKEYSELSMLNFDTLTSYAVVNEATASSNGSPSYTEGPLETSKFKIEAGPMNGTYKIISTGPDGTRTGGNDFVLAAPANGGNTIFLVDTRNGMTGVCQKI